MALLVAGALSKVDLRNKTALQRTNPMLPELRTAALSWLPKHHHMLCLPLTSLQKLGKRLVPTVLFAGTVVTSLLDLLNSCPEITAAGGCFQR